MYNRYLLFVGCLIVLCGCSDSVSITSQSMAEHFDAYCVMTGGTLDESSDKTYIYGVCNCAGNPCIDSGCTADGLNCNTAERRLCKEGATRCVNVPDETGASIGHLQRCEDGQFRDHEECAQVSCHYGNNDQENGVCGECIDHKLQCSDDGIVNCENGKLAYMIEPCADKRGCILKNGIPQCASCDSSSGDYCANGYMNRCVDGRYVQERCPNGDCKGTTQCGDCHDGDFGCLAILDSDGMRWFYRSTCMGGEFKTIQESEKTLLLTSLDTKFYDNETCEPCTNGSKRCVDYKGKSYTFSCQPDGSYQFSELCANGCDGDQCQTAPQPPKDFCEDLVDGVYCDTDGHIIQCKDKKTSQTYTESCVTIDNKSYSCKGLTSASAKECTGGCLNEFSPAVCMTKANVEKNTLSLRLSPQWQFIDDAEDKINNNNKETQRVGTIKKGTEVRVLGCTKRKDIEGTTHVCLFNYDDVDPKFFYTAYSNFKFSSGANVNDLLDYDIFISSITPNYVISMWDSHTAVYEKAVGKSVSALVALMDVLCVLIEKTTRQGDGKLCSYYDAKTNKITDSFKNLIDNIVEYNNQFNVTSPNGVRNGIICTLLKEKYELDCNYWHHNDHQYTSQTCENGNCFSTEPSTNLDQDKIVDRMANVLKEGGFIIAKMNKGQESDYWGSDYRAFVIYGMDKNAKVLYIDDPAGLHFSETFDSFFERNTDLFFVTK